MTNTTKTSGQNARTTDGAERAPRRRTLTPRADVVETKDSFLIVADMPGVDEGSADVTLEDNRLTIAGRAEEPAAQGRRPIHEEYEVGDYERTFTLPDAVDQDAIEASMRQGVLRVKLPKAAPAGVKQIAVKAVE